MENYSTYIPHIKENESDEEGNDEGENVCTESLLLGFQDSVSQNPTHNH